MDIHSSSLPCLGQPEPDNDYPYIVVHMFPSGYKSWYKEWSDRHWMQLIDGLTSRGNTVVLTGGPADVPSCRRIAGTCRNTDRIDIRAGKTSLAQLGELLRRAVVVVSVNTGVMHLAAAYGLQIVALHGPTSVPRWGPLCEHSHNFSANSRSAGCLHLGFEYDRLDQHSLDTIDPRDVLKAVIKIIQ